VTPPTIVVQWPRIGPYHLARLRAAHAVATARGGTLIALETAGDDAVYAWDQETAAEPFERVQVFPGATFESLAPRAIVAGITEALDRLDPEAVVINSYSAPDAQAALLWCRRNRRPAVCLMESKADDAERAAGREWVKGHLVRSFDAALAGGSPQAAYLTDLGFPADAVFFTCDAIDNVYFRTGAEAARADPEAGRGLPGLDDPSPFFLASNRFVARKNLPVLLDAYHRYRRAAGDAAWRLVMLGDGPQRSALEQQVADAGTEGVTFAGFRQIAELPTYYGRAAAFVHPALVEQWGLVVNEAMASGLPVVVSERVGSAADLVRDGETGFPFDPTRPEALAALLGRVAALPAAERARLGQRGQEVVEGWSPEAFANGLWDAVAFARARAGRGPSVILRMLLEAMWTGSRRVGSYYAIPE
jgi:glycosyltransferase involved in cell wall biosynthesis